jgi:hypothetical protein
MLECLDKSENFINISANWGIVDLRVSQDTITIDNVGSSHVDSIILGEATIVFTDLLGQIGQHGNLHSSKTTLSSWEVCELLMSEV